MFEFFFKYPAPVFARGKLVFLAQWPAWVALLLAVAAAGLLVWQLRRRPAGLTALRKTTVLTLESVFLALLLLLLWHPALSVARLRPQQNIVAVLLDASRSMAIEEDGHTRMAAAQDVLRTNLIDALTRQFQTRVYRFGESAERVPDASSKTTANLPATHLSESLEAVLAETAGLPLGAIVVLSDGADNSGGVARESIAHLRQQRVPVETIGFGRERNDHDLEMEDVSLPQRALAGARLSATARFRQYGFGGQRARVTVRDANAILAAKDITLQPDGAVQTETVLFNGGASGARAVQVRVDPLPGETNLDNNALTRVVNISPRRPRVLYFEGEPRWEYKFIRRAADDDRSIDLVSMVRTTPNKIYRQGISGKEELAAGFPSQAAELFAYDALIIGSVEANYFTPAQQQLIHEFASRRGGGVLFLGGRFSLADGGYARTPLAAMLPVELPAQTPTFQREYAQAELAQAGRDSVICRLEDTPEKNEARWKKMPLLANSQAVGAAKPGAVTLLEVTAPGRHRAPLLVTQNYGRGRVAVLASAGTWRWKMQQAHDDASQQTFWRQMLRWLSAETSGPVSSSTPQQVLNDAARAPLRAEVRNEEFQPVTDAQVEGRVTGSAGVSDTLKLTPSSTEAGVYTADWKVPQPGDYLVEVVASRGGKELGRDIVTFRREDGAAEHFHTAQNRELLQKLSQETGGHYRGARDAAALPREIAYSEAGVTEQETLDLWDMPALLLLAFGIRTAEWLLRRRWGAV